MIGNPHTTCLNPILESWYIDTFLASRKHAYIILTPLKPHFYIVYFYIVKLGFTGIYTIFLISAEKHRLWVLVRTASLRRFQREPTIYVLRRNMKNIRIFYLKIFSFLVVKFSVYLNRHVFVMVSPWKHIKADALQMSIYNIWKIFIWAPLLSRVM